MNGNYKPEPLAVAVDKVGDDFPSVGVQLQHGWAESA